MKLASHNSFSYAEPSRWWMRLFNPFSRCQRYSVTSQFLVWKVRDYDMRIRFNELDRPVFAHGIVEYDLDVMATLDHLASLAESYGEKVSIRIMLEDTFGHNNSRQRQLFSKFCNDLKLINVNYKFNLYGGWTKSGWRDDIISDLGEEKAILEKHSSVCWKGIFKVLTELYAVLHNAENAESLKSSEYVFMCDFVEYC